MGQIGLSVVLGVLVVAAAPLAISQQTPGNVEMVFGIPFGAPLDRGFPACADAARNLDDYCGRIEAIQHGVAGAREFSLRRPGYDTKIPIPTWVVGTESVFVKLDKQGMVSSLHATTVGPAQQARVIESVTSRFGAPTDQATRTAQNGFGQKWEVTRAEWDLPHVYIAHNCSKISECYILFFTPTERDAQREAAKRRLQKDRM